MESGPYDAGSVEETVRDIAVKQVVVRRNVGLKDESKTMEKLTFTGSRHIPQLYGAVQRDIGLQGQLRVDMVKTEVHRIFMEYFRGGSIYGYLLRYAPSYFLRTPIPEPMLWSLFHCMAKAASVMERGHEQGSKAPAANIYPWKNGLQMVHFDIKPDNVFVAEKDDGEHRAAERIALADFGMVINIPSQWPNSDHERTMYLNERSGFGTDGFFAPVRQVSYITTPCSVY